MSRTPFSPSLKQRRRKLRRPPPANEPSCGASRSQRNAPSTTTLRPPLASAQRDARRAPSSRDDAVQATPVSRRRRASQGALGHHQQPQPSRSHPQRRERGPSGGGFRENLQLASRAKIPRARNATLPAPQRPAPVGARSATRAPALEAASEPSCGASRSQRNAPSTTTLLLQLASAQRDARSPLRSPRSWPSLRGHGAVDEVQVWQMRALRSGACSAQGCPGTESNRRHEDFQSSALPTELPGLASGRESGPGAGGGARRPFILVRFGRRRGDR